MANGVAFAHAASPTAGAVDNHTALEEAEGKAMWEKLRAKEAVCADLSDGDFGALGEYFMGQMMGTSHEAMNAMMAQMLGEDGEEQMHVVMGKRMSGCDASAVYPAGGIGFMPMMQTMMGGGMMGGWSSPSAFSNYNNSMMGFGFAPLGGFGWIFMVLWWALIIAGIVALVRWFANQPRVSRDGEKSPLEILKERYAKGEIDQNEFEEKKKDLLEK
ncbi:MAG: SHOCT domain-containing protein [Candidatus Harrisonbacteria bacterium]|nr:SHOCT domain-containing protein [Candidatus Harrisonbacteria bacterium]